MLELCLETKVLRDERKQEMQRLLRFLMVGGLGAIENLACFTGVYYPLLRITGSSVAYAIAFLVGTETSIVFNFVLNDRLTFGDLHWRSWRLRCLRYHVTSTLGFLLTLGSSFALIHLLHIPVFFAQATALLIATAFNFTLHQVFTYGHSVVKVPSTTVPLREIAR
jgi:putative flippase GtrA